MKIVTVVGARLQFINPPSPSLWWTPPEADLRFRQYRQDIVAGSM